MQIFIPTRDRVNAQFTWDNLHSLQKFTTLVCPTEEVETHRKAGRNAVARPPVRLAAVRQWIVDELANQQEPVIMCDDDLAFFVRRVPALHNLRPAGEDVFQIFDRLHALVLDGSPSYTGEPFNHAGLSPRQGNNWSWPSTININDRMNAVHCIWPGVLKHYGIRYDDVTMMEDYHATLSLFEKGEKSATIVDAAWDQCKGSGAPGGFSHFRTSETQSEAAHTLAKLHPLTVKVVEKTPSTGSGGFAGTRTDVRVQWKQAYLKGNKSPTYVRSV